MIPRREGVTGYWEPHTASIDFCEENYDYHPLVAEAWNSFSALVLVIIPLWNLVLTPRPFSNWPRFFWCQVTLAIVGVGSVIFHATLKRATQGLDEVPMVIVNLVYVYCVVLLGPKDQPKHELYGCMNHSIDAKPLAAGLTLLGLIFIGTYFVLHWYAIFLTCFACECVGLIIYAYWLIFHKEVGKNTQVMRSILIIDVSVFALAFGCWALDNVACIYLGSGALHIVWHLLGGFSSSMFPLILLALTADAEGMSFCLQWSYGLMPCLTLDSQEEGMGEMAKGLSNKIDFEAIDKCTTKIIEESAATFEMPGSFKLDQHLLFIIFEAACAIGLQVMVQVLLIPSRSFGALFGRRHEEVEEEGQAFSGPSVSFYTSFWWPYTAGVCQYLFEEFDLTNARFFTTSGNTFPVVCAMMGVNPLHWCMVDFPKCLAHWGARPLSCFLDSTAFLRQLWHGFLPADAHQRAEGRLVVSLTRIDCTARMHNEQVSTFQSKNDLIDCLVDAVNMPGIFFRGLPIRHCKFCINGMYTEKKRKADKKTVVIGISRSCDIRPSKRMPWLWAILPQPMERTKQMMRQGYEDARANHEVFAKQGWRIKAAGPSESSK